MKSYVEKCFNKDYLKNLDINKVGNIYTTKLRDISSAYRNDFIVEDDMKLDDRVSIWEDELECLDSYDSLEYEDTDEEYVNETIKDLMKQYPSYLVILEHYRWDGSSGYGIEDNLKDAIRRSYSCSQYVVGSSPKGKALLLKEYHHDKPMGHNALIVGLTKRELNMVENCSKAMQDIKNIAIKSIISLEV